MPNWVYNEVEISAPLAEVQEFLAPDFDMDDPNLPILRFNLHRLFPERFDASDILGKIGWDYDWMIENTGSKWNPEVSLVTNNASETFLAFDSAWTPVNPLLERLHKLTGWMIHNTFEEESRQYEGDFHAEDSSTWEDLRPGRPRCSCCEERFNEDDLEPDFGECPVCALGRSDYLVTLKPDVAAKLQLKASGSFDLSGNVVLGLYSVRTLEHAYTQAIAQLPQEALEGVDVYSDPEGFGLWAYRLAKEGE